MADMTLLATSENYAALLARIDAKINAIAQQYISDAPTAIPAGKTPVRFNPASRIWEQWNGSAWAALSGTYGLTVDKADSLKDSGGNYRTLNTGAVANAIVMRDAAGKVPGSITGDADTLDGYHSSAFATAAQGAKADAALAAALYTAADILTKLLTVDGTGSGLDADTVDGIQGSQIITTGNIGGQSVAYASSSNTSNSANYATSAGSASTATSAGSATNATNATYASNVPWSGVSGKPSSYPTSGYTGDIVGLGLTVVNGLITGYSQ